MSRESTAPIVHPSAPVIGGIHRLLRLLDEIDRIDAEQADVEQPQEETAGRSDG